MKIILTLLVTLVAFSLWPLAQAAEPAIEVVGTVRGAKPLPIRLSGFSGEVKAVLEFDLFVQGFGFDAEHADFQVDGSNNSQVMGRLQDTTAKKEIFSKSYTGASLRAQAHALADDIVEAITKRKGIGRTKIAYRRDTSGGNSEIHVADLDGHNSVAATSDNALVVSPTWMPGRRMLYYTSYKMENPDIYSHDLDSGKRHIVARYGGSNISPAVSPDGRRVAMILSKSGRPNVWVANADGTDLKQLTTLTGGAASPCWSPDGKRICFSSDEAGTALYTISSGGGQPRKLRVVGVTRPVEPDWSPDGKTIAFTSMAGTFTICTVPAEGGDASVLVDGENPKWAANSRTIIFELRKGNRSTLSMLDAPTKRAKPLPSISGSCSQPSWSK